MVFHGCSGVERSNNAVYEREKALNTETIRINLIVKHSAKK
jgi:hypothetical protein